MRIPEDLSQQLQAFERRLRRIETAVASTAALTGALGTLAAIALLDRFFDTPTFLRAALAAANALALSLSALWWARHWLWRRRNVRDLARLIQRRYPQLGDRLLGAVELAEADIQALGASPALVRAALRQVAEQSQRYDFREAAPQRAIHRYSTALATLTALLVLGAILAPEAILRSARRWLRPTAPLERFTFTRIADLPNILYVPRGESFELVCGIAPGSRWRPSRGIARIGDQPPVRAAVRGDIARFAFPGQTAENLLWVRLGDDRRRIQLRPLHRPELLAMHVRIEWPAYLRREPEERAIERGRLALLAEARAAFVGHAARQLVEARLEPVASGEAESLRIDGAQFFSAMRPIREWANGATEGKPTLLQFVWRDAYGLSGARPYQLELLARPDAPPSVDVEGIRGAVAMLPDETLPLTARARDDFGVAAVGWEWIAHDANTEPAATVTPATRRVVGEDAGGGLRELEGVWRLSPRLLDITPGQAVTLWAWAVDHFPTRDPTRAGPFRIYVLSYEDHARLVRQMMDQLAARMDELLRQEELQIAQSEALRELDDDTLRAASTTAAIERGEQAERANEAAAKQLAADIENMLREGLRNAKISAAELQPWTAAEAALRDAVAQAMAQAAQALRQAASDPSSADRSRERLAQANTAQREAAEALRRSAQETERQTENAQARNFINRMREVARRERELAAAFAGLLPQAVGLRPEGIGSSLRARLQIVAEEHERIQREARYIRDDLGAFFARTRREIFGRIRDQMTTPDVLEMFKAIESRIGRIHLSLGIGEAEALAARFEEWAAMLEPNADSNGGGGGGDGGGEQEGLNPEVLLGLMRARVIEEMLREQTRAAHESNDAPTIEQAARLIGARQGDVSGLFRGLLDKARTFEVTMFLQRLASLSDEARQRVIRPDMGPETIGVQTQIIEEIAGLMQSRRNTSSSSSESEQGAGSQQMMLGLVQGQGMQGGGSTAGGDSAGVGQHSGPGSGDMETRLSARASRPDVSTWPAEYRDAIHAYYERLDTER